MGQRVTEEREGWHKTQRTKKQRERSDTVKGVRQQEDMYIPGEKKRTQSSK